MPEAAHGDIPSIGNTDGPRDSGVYAAIFHLDGGSKMLRIGALGDLEFAPGYYAYVGSALSGLRARIGRHLGGGPKNLHWHIDYLARHARPVGALAWLTDERLECRLSVMVSEMSEYSVPGFGSSDCNCTSHLHFFAGDPRPRLKDLRLTGQDGNRCPLDVLPKGDH